MSKQSEQKDREHEHIMSLEHQMECKKCQSIVRRGQEKSYEQGRKEEREKIIKGLDEILMAFDAENLPAVELMDSLIAFRRDSLN